MPIISLTEKLKTLYSLQDTLPKIIEDDTVPEQKMDEYYVKLQMLMGNKNTGEKQSIEVEQIFTPLDSQLEAQKILILGGAGIGKSTFLNNIAYRWGRNDLFENKFAYVFKVKLKLLLTDWKDDYDMKDINEKPLECFIDYSLRQDIKLIKMSGDFLIKTDEILRTIRPINQDKILLLLDGYDEVAQMASQAGVVLNTFREIFKFKHVVVTSRPNVLTSHLENRFDRYIESTGFTPDAVEEYINNYFLKQELMQANKFGGSRATKVSKEIHERHIHLLELLRSNHNVRELATTPLNTALLCLICSDNEIMSRFASDSNVGVLYQEVILWLGKRYIHKASPDRDVSSINDGDIFDLDVLKTLKIVAYEGFKHNRLVLEGRFIDQKAQTTKAKLNIKEVNKFGLLKVDNSAKASSSNDLINQEHVFIHLSFQEYLTAHYLKDQLLSNDFIESHEAAEFIAIHRNEPKYLVTLKFLVGLITQEQISLEAINKFWEAIICNVDGVIELGINAKVTLLMHLLEQAKIKGEIDYRIPYLEKIKDLIDIVTTLDITNFHNQIIASGYSSPKIVEAVLAILDLNYRWRIENAGEILQRQGEFSLLAEINLKEIVENCDYGEQLKVLAKEILTQNNVIFSADRSIITPNERIITVRNIELKTAIKIALRLTTSGNLSAQVLVTKILEILSNPDWQVKFVAIEAITQLIKTKNNLIDFNLEFAREIIDLVQWHITDGNLRQEVFGLIESMQDALSKQEEPEFEMHAKQVVIDQLQIFYKDKKIIDFIDKLPPSPSIELINKDMVDGLIQQSKDINWLQSYNALVLLSKIVKQKPQLFDITIYEILMQKLDASCSDVSYAVNELFQAAASIIPDLINIDICVILMNKLRTSDTDVRCAIANIAGTIAAIRPELINADIRKSLITQLHDKESNGEVSKTVAAILNAIASTQPDLIIDSLYNNVVSAASAFVTIASSKPDLIDINSLIGSSNYVNADYVSTVSKIIGVITSIRPDLLPINNLISKLRSAAYNDGYAVAGAFGAIAFAQPNLINADIIQILLTKIDRGFDVSRAATKTLQIIASVRPDLINVNIVNALLTQIDKNLWRVALVLGAIALSRPDLINSDIYEILIDRLQLKEVVWAVGAIASTKPNLINTDIYKLLVKKINDIKHVDWQNRSFVEEVASALDIIASKRPDLIDVDIYSSLVNKFRGVWDDFIFHLTSKIINIALIRPDLINIEITKNLVEKFGYNGSFNFSSAVVELLGTIASLRPELINTEDLTSKLSDSDKWIKRDAIKALGVIASNKPNLISSDIVMDLISCSSDKEYIVRREAVKVVQAIASARPDLINSDIYHIIVSKLFDNHGDVRSASAEAISIITSRRTDLIKDDIYSILTSKLNDEYPKVRSAVAGVIGVIASARPDLVNMDILVNNLSDGSHLVRLASVGAVDALIATRSGLINSNMVNDLITKLKDSNSNVISDAARTIGYIALTNLNLINSVVTISLVEKLSDGSDYGRVCQTVSIALSNIISTRADLINSDIVDSLIKDLSDDDRHVGQEVTKVLGLIASILPELINSRVIAALVAKLSDNNSDVRSEVANVFGIIARTSPGLIDFETITNLVESVHDNNSIRAGGVSAIGAIVPILPDLITTDLYESMVNGLSNNNFEVKFAIAKTIGALVLARPELFSSELLTKLFKLLDINDHLHDVYKITGSTLEALASSRPDLITFDLCSLLIGKLSSNHDCVVIGATKVICAIIKTRADLVNAISLRDNLVSKLSDMNYSVRAGAADALGIMIFTFPDLGNIDIVTDLIKLTSDKEYYATKGAVRAIRAIVLTRSYLINLDMVSQLIENFSNSDSNIRYVAVGVFSDVVYARPDLIELNMGNYLINKLNDKGHIITISSVAATALGIIASVRPDFLDLEMIINLIEKLSDSTYGAQAEAAKTIGIVASNRPDLIHFDMSNALIANLSHGNFDTRSAIRKAFFIITNTVSSAVIGLLNHPSKEAREFVQQVFIAILLNSEEQSKMRIETILAIIAFHDPNNKEKKNLIELAKKVLYDKLLTLDQDDVAWITAEYDNLLKLSSESQLFLQKLYHKILSIQLITEIEKGFIIKTIEHGVSTSITRDGHIIFENNIYKLGVENTSDLDDIIAIILQQKESILIKQNIAHNAIFANSGVGLKIAANDINTKEVSSLINSAESLMIDFWKVAFMHLSNNHKSSPQEIFILLEKRNPFGDHEIHKLFIHGNAIVNHQYILHPLEVNSAFRQEIFGSMEYIESKPRYFGKTFSINLADGYNLLKLLQSSNITTYKKLIEVLNNLLNTNFADNWELFVKEAIEYTKYELLALSGGDHARARRDSNRIENNDKALPIAVSLSPGVNNLESLSQQIAQEVLARIRILLKAKDFISGDSELEEEFVYELAKKLRTTNKILLELTKKNHDLRSDLIKQLAAEFKKSGKSYVIDGRFYIQEELRDDSGEFLNPIIAQVKEVIKQSEYIDEIGNTLTILYVNNIHYDSDNLLLPRDELLYEAGQIGGIEAINNLIELGDDRVIARVIIDATKQYGARHIANVIFTPKAAENIELLEIEASLVDTKVISSRRSSVTSDSKTPFIQTFTVSDIFKEFINGILIKLDLDINWLYKSAIYRQEIIKFNEILQNNGIDRSVDVLQDYSDFRKSVLLKLHPDKGGNEADFIFVKNLQEKINVDLDINRLLVEMQQLVYQAGTSFKALDTIVDTTRLIYEPTIDHSKKLAFDLSYIYSMYSGVNGYSLYLTGADIAYKAFQGEYEQAFKQALISSSYMALPSVIEYVGIPCFGLIYGAGITIYTGYSAITNAYSFYEEYSGTEHGLKSAIAYKAFAENLAISPLQYVYDLTDTIKAYSIKVNNIKLDLEKAALKTQLETKGEFGQKLYDYIYAPTLEEKYALLNQIIEEKITEEQAETLKAKHIKITLENQIYGNCIEIKNVEANIDREDIFNKEHYYCYNEEQQMIDHIVIGENRDYIEMVERL